MHCFIFTSPTALGLGNREKADVLEMEVLEGMGKSCGGRIYLVGVNGCGRGNGGSGGVRGWDGMGWDGVKVR